MHCWAPGGRFHSARALTGAASMPCSHVLQVHAQAPGRASAVHPCLGSPRPTAQGLARFPVTRGRYPWWERESQRQSDRPRERRQGRGP